MPELERIFHICVKYERICHAFKNTNEFVTHVTNTGWPLVREKTGKFHFSSRSGKSQGILQFCQGNFKYQESQGKVREFHNFGPKYVADILTT